MCARLASSGRKHPPVAAAQGSSPDCRFGDGAGSQFIDYTALSSKPAARRCCCRSMGQTDRRTDGRTLDRFIIVNPGVPLTLILCFLSSNLYLYFIAIVWIQHVLLPYQTKRFDFEWTLLRTLYTYIRVYMERVCVQPRPSAVNMTLPAFAGERRAAAPLSIYFSCSALSSKLVASHCCCRSIE